MFWRSDFRRADIWQAGRVWRVLVLLLACLWAREAAAEGRSVTFRADDGRTVTGTVFEASRPPAAAVVLLPALGHPRDEWQAIAQQFADQNITALAIDLPGATAPADPRDLAGWQVVVRAGVNWLSAQWNVRPTAIGAAGSSLGGSLVALAAAGDPRIKALALISPSLDFRGVRIEAAMRQIGSRPVLLVASRRDSYASRSVRELTSDPPGPRETVVGEAASHGVPLLAAEPDLARQLVDWFQRTLAVN
jgi:alpha-beta hydrolase superfamily lysophospholipase